MPHFIASFRLSAVPFILVAVLGVAAAEANPYPGRTDDKGAGGVEGQGAPKQGDPAPETTRRSQDQIIRMSELYVERLEEFRFKGGTVSISGFSDVMSGWIVYLLSVDRRRTQRLLRDLKDVEDDDDRRSRLNREMRDVNDLIDNVYRSIERLRQAENWDAVSEERSLRRRLADFRRGLQVWVDHPWEGAR